MVELKQRAHGLADRGLPSASFDVVPTHSSLTEACGPGDDWSGVKERAERRKIQNRLNVRAHRKRKALEGGNLLDNVLASRRRKPRTGARSTTGQTAIEGSVSNQVPTNAQHSRNTRQAIFAHLRSNRGLGELKSRFPISRDHLIPLIQYNALRAILTNIHVLYICNLIIQPFPNSSCVPTEIQRVVLWDTSQPAQQPPDTLQLTPLQQQRPHGPWIDTLPLAKMRDNAIMLEGSFDFEEFMTDCFGAMCNSGRDRDSSGDCGVIAWSDPWHPRGWEFTEGFIRKWKRSMLEGCEDTIETTNYWRSLRDEEPLVWDDL
ncbi:unnamed protein product [Clonostachys rhizophaga]|uniref:BZIP domain-containing protein n=1 Tax=Clonostachys rhizophaga TaxID=160324 RepID=A0A9N9VH23_9HYPO|nr:unnamed protein product [Clonostachys rhizophaga]